MKARKVSRNPVKKLGRKPSAGKSDLYAIFNSIKPMMKKYEDPLVARVDNDSRYDLWSEKNVVIAGRPRKEVYFASVVIQSNYVGFYFMPIYTHEGQKKVFKPELLKTLKGKSCFHIKSPDPELMRQVDEALRIGFDLYKKNGWV